MTNQERKIIQIAVHPDDNCHDLYALCNDGTILHLDTELQWYVIPTGPVPQPESEALIAAITDENLNRDEL